MKLCIGSMRILSLIIKSQEKFSRFSVRKKYLELKCLAKLILCVNGGSEILKVFKIRKPKNVHLGVIFSFF